MFAIEKKPLSAKIYANMTREKYPWRAMKAGSDDSFFVPIPLGKKANRVQSNALSCARTYQIRGTSRRVTENGVEGIRFWRLE